MNTNWDVLGTVPSERHLFWYDSLANNKNTPWQIITCAMNSHSHSINAIWDTDRVLSLAACVHTRVHSGVPPRRCADTIGCMWWFSMSTDFRGHMRRPHSRRVKHTECQIEDRSAWARYERCRQPVWSYWNALRCHNDMLLRHITCNYMECVSKVVLGTWKATVEHP